MEAMCTPIPPPPPATLGALAGLLPLTPFTLVLFVAAWSVDAAAAARVTLPAVTAALRACGYSPPFLATTPVTVTVHDLYGDDTASAAAAAADAATRAAEGRGRLWLFPATRRRHVGAATAAVEALRSAPLLPSLVLFGAPPPGGGEGGGGPPSPSRWAPARRRSPTRRSRRFADTRQRPCTLPPGGETPLAGGVGRGRDGRVAAV